MTLSCQDYTHLKIQIRTPGKGKTLTKCHEIIGPGEPKPSVAMLLLGKYWKQKANLVFPQRWRLEMVWVSWRLTHQLTELTQIYLLLLSKTSLPSWVMCQLHPLTCELLNTWSTLLFKLLIKNKPTAGLQTFADVNPSTQEVEAGRSLWVSGQPVLHNIEN